MLAELQAEAEITCAAGHLTSSGGVQEVTPYILVLLSQCALYARGPLPAGGCLTPAFSFFVHTDTALTSLFYKLVHTLSAECRACLCRCAFWQHYQHSCQAQVNYFTVLLHKRASVHSARPAAVKRFPGTRMSAPLPCLQF